MATGLYDFTLDETLTNPVGAERFDFVVKIAVPYATFTLATGEANAAHELIVKAVKTP